MNRDPQALWVRCPGCGRDIDVPPSRLLAFLEYKLAGITRRTKPAPTEEV